MVLAMASFAWPSVMVPKGTKFNYIHWKFHILFPAYPIPSYRPHEQQQIKLKWPYDNAVKLALATEASERDAKHLTGEDTLFFIFFI